MTPDNRLHNLLKLIIDICEEADANNEREDDEYTISYSTLHFPSNKTTLHELLYLCKVLEGDGLLHIDEDSQWIWLNEQDLDNVRQHYDANVYKKQQDFWAFPLNMSSILNAIATIGVLILAYNSNSQQNEIDQLNKELEVTIKEASRIKNERDSTILVLKTMKLAHPDSAANK